MNLDIENAYFYRNDFSLIMCCLIRVIILVIHGTTVIGIKIILLPIIVEEIVVERRTK